ARDSPSVGSQSSSVSAQLSPRRSRRFASRKATANASIPGPFHGARIGQARPGNRGDTNRGVSSEASNRGIEAGEGRGGRGSGGGRSGGGRLGGGPGRTGPARSGARYIKDTAPDGSTAPRRRP